MEIHAPMYRILESLWHVSTSSVLRIQIVHTSYEIKSEANLSFYLFSEPIWERSGSVVECLTRDRRATGSSLTRVTALWSLSKTHHPILVLVQSRKTRPCLTERLLIGRKESKQNQNQYLGTRQFTDKTIHRHSF